MAHKLLIACLLPALAAGAVWPDSFAGFRKLKAEALAVADRPLWDEYGLMEAESARYAVDGREIEVAAWRMNDSTGAFGAFEWTRPAGARTLALGQAAAGTATETLVAEGNYLLRFKGLRPKPEQLKALAEALPRFRRTQLPGVVGFLPQKDLVPGSERFLLGPAGLEKFLPAIPAQAAGFEFSGEAQSGAYRTASGEVRMAVFYYPTPAIARQQLAALEKLSGISARRSGPLVAAVAAGAEQAAALLDRVRYEANFTWNERAPNRRDNVGELILSAFALAGFLLLVCVGGGLAVGGVRMFASRKGHEEITLLRIAR